MSDEHAIDLSFGSQDLFRSFIHDAIKKATYWMVFDHDGNVLVSNCNFDLEVHIYSQKNTPIYSDSPFLSTVFIEDQNYAVFSPHYLYKIPVIYKGNSCLLHSYYKILTSDLYHFLFNSCDFNKKDYFGNELDFNFQVNRLKDSNPLSVLTKKEWAIGWLLINGFSTQEISDILNLKINSVRKYIEKILGIQKLAIFKRELFIHLAHYLGWNLYIPSLFIKKHCIKKHMQVAY